MISVQNDGPVCVINIDRESKLNALTKTMYQDMAIALEEAANHDEVNVVVITGGNNCFTSGNDISFFLDEDFLSSDNPLREFLIALANFPKPIIAGVAGVAIGIGVTLLLHCDLVYCAKNATFALPFAKIGVCPEFAVSLLLPRRVGHQKAFELLTLNEGFDAQQALEAKIVNQIVADDVVSHVKERAQVLASMPKEAVLTTKKLLKAPLLPIINDTIQKELQDFVRLVSMESTKENFMKFLSSKN